MSLFSRFRRWICLKNIFLFSKSVNVTFRLVGLFSVEGFGLVWSLRMNLYLTFSQFIFLRICWKISWDCSRLSFVSMHWSWSGQNIRIYSILESTCHSLESTHISKRNRLKLNLFTLLIANGMESTLVNSESTLVNSNIRPWLSSLPLAKAYSYLFSV